MKKGRTLPLMAVCAFDYSYSVRSILLLFSNISRIEYSLPDSDHIDRMCR